jgi:protein SCO1/2
MKHSALIFWVGLALVGSAAYGSWVAWRNLRADEPRSSASPSAHVAHRLPAGPPIKDFQLVERSGRKFDSKELQGQVWVGSFFFSSCPGPCWQMNQALKGVHDEFKNTDLRLISISCDPKNDSPEVLRNYADRFQADPYRWLFLTGDLDYIKRIGHDIFYQDVQESTHRLSVLVIDRNGKIRGSFDLLDAAKVAEMKTLLKQLLDEKAAAPASPDAPAKSAEKAQS